MIIKESINNKKNANSSPETEKIKRISVLAQMLRSAVDVFDDSGDLIVETFSPRASRFDPDAAVKRVVGLFANERSTVTFLT